MEYTGDLVLDLLLLDALFVVVVVGLYASYLKFRSFFKARRRSKTRRKIDHAPTWVGMDSEVYELWERRSAAGNPHSGVSLLSSGRRSRSGSPVRSFWIPYFRQRGLAGVIARRRLERRVRLLLVGCSKSELDKIAFSLMYWRHHDCPDNELYIPRPPHRVSLRPIPHHFDERELGNRILIAATLAAKPRKELLQATLDHLRDFSSRSLQWLADCIENDWVGEIGATRSRTIRLTSESERLSSSLPPSGARRPST